MLLSQIIKPARSCLKIAYELFNQAFSSKNPSEEFILRKPELAKTKGNNNVISTEMGDEGVEAVIRYPVFDKDDFIEEAIDGTSRPAQRMKPNPALKNNDEMLSRKPDKFIKSLSKYNLLNRIKILINEGLININERRARRDYIHNKVENQEKLTTNPVPKDTQVTFNEVVRVYGEDFAIDNSAPLDDIPVQENKQTDYSKLYKYKSFGLEGDQAKDTIREYDSQLQANKESLAINKDSSQAIEMVFEQGIHLEPVTKSKSDSDTKSTASMTASENNLDVPYDKKIADCWQKQDIADDETLVTSNRSPHDKPVQEKEQTPKFKYNPFTLPNANWFERQHKKFEKLTSWASRCDGSGFGIYDA